MKKPGAMAEMVQNFKGFVVLRSSTKLPKTAPSASASSTDEEKGALPNTKEGADTMAVPHAATNKSPGGWRTMPYIIGNETFERVASFGLTANLTVYLLKRYHMQQVDAVNLTNIWNGTTNFIPLLGAFLADAYWGKFKTLAFACVATFLGMIMMTLTAAIPGLQPSRCTAEALMKGQCQGPSGGHLGVLILALGLLTLGAGGVRPCSIPFGMDQFDRSTDQGKHGTNSFFNWYYATNTAAVMVATTIVVYLQDSVSWVLGFALCAGFMLVALLMFFWGARMYVFVPPDGSVFTSILQVLVAAFNKRGVKLPEPMDQERMLYNPPLSVKQLNNPVVRLPLTQQFSFLNKAAVVLEGDLKPPPTAATPTTDDQHHPNSNSNANDHLNAANLCLARPWHLASIQRIEEVKCLIRVIPIWASGITCFVAISQQWTYVVLQSITMDRHLGPHFQIPPASMPAFALLAIVLFLPVYDRLLVPLLRRLTRVQSGITLLQRMGVGIVISAFSMVVAGIVERKRRNSALDHGGFMSPMSALWLVPQLALVGVSEAFNAVGQIEFYNQQFPDQMRSLATSLFSVSVAGASYLSSLVLTLIHNETGKNGRPNWLDNNINAARVDYYYYVLAVMGAVNLVYFIIVSHFYHYKGVPDAQHNICHDNNKEGHQQMLQQQHPSTPHHQQPLKEADAAGVLVQH